MMGEGFRGVWLKGDFDYLVLGMVCLPSEAAHSLPTLQMKILGYKQFYHFFVNKWTVKLTLPKNNMTGWKIPAFLIGDTSWETSQSFVSFPLWVSKSIRNPLRKKQVTIQVVTRLSVSFTDCQLVAVGKLQLRVGLDKTSEIFWVRRYKVGVYTRTHMYIYIYIPGIYIHIYIKIYTYFII